MKGNDHHDDPECGHGFPWSFSGNDRSLRIPSATLLSRVQQPSVAIGMVPLFGSLVWFPSFFTISYVSDPQPIKILYHPGPHLLLLRHRMDLPFVFLAAIGHNFHNSMLHQ